MLRDTNGRQSTIHRHKHEYIRLSMSHFPSKPSYQPCIIKHLLLMRLQNALSNPICFDKPAHLINKVFQVGQQMKIHCIPLINSPTKSVAHSFSLPCQLLSRHTVLQVTYLLDVYKNKQKNEQESGRQKYDRQQEMDRSCVSITPERLTEKHKIVSQETNHCFIQSNYDKTVFVTQKDTVETHLSKNNEAGLP